MGGVILTQILLILFSCSVNIFAICTGYLYINKKTINYKNIVSLMFICLFYNVLITSTSIFLSKSQGPRVMLNYLFPPFGNRHWYVTSYLILFCCIPVLNKYFMELEKNAFRNFLILFFLLFSCCSMFSFHDLFFINWGYSFPWLIFCYLIGAYLKKYPICYKTKRLLAVIIINLLIVFISRLCIAKLTLRLLGKESHVNYFMQYISPFVLENAICLVVLFSRITVTKDVSKKIIELLSILSFDVYVIHAHPYVLDNFIYKKFNFIFQNSIIKTFVSIVISIFSVYLVCSFIGLFRKSIFRLLKIDNLTKVLGDKLNHAFF